MFQIHDDMSIHITRGDIGVVKVTAFNDNQEPHMFQPGDIIRFSVFPKKDHKTVMLRKDITVQNETDVVAVNLHGNDTKLGEIINKPVVYWYEVELNPDTVPQTIVGYDADGPKLFTLYPEGGEPT